MEYHAKIKSQKKNNKITKVYHAKIKYISELNKK